MVTRPLPALSELLYWPPGQAPWAKQEAAHQASSAERLFALFMEQRTGKTIVTLGTCAYQYSRFLAEGGFVPASRGTPPGSAPQHRPGGVFELLPKKFREAREGAKTWTRIEPRISDLPKAPALEFIYRPKSWATKGMDALLVVAMPSGVPSNWAEEIELRLPKSMNARVLVYDADRTGSTEFAREFRELLCHEGFAALLINGEAITTADGKKAIGTFLRTRRAVTVGDETSLICSQPGNVRSHAMEALRKLPGAICRRILDGTPGDESPLDMFSQMRFLDWQILGHDSWTAFKNFYASWEVAEIWVKDPKTGKPTQRAINRQVVEEDTNKKVFANLDVMAKKLAPYSFRVKRADCFDIPDKVRVPYRFDLSEAQRRVYDPLRDEFEAWLADGTKVTAKHALARMTRLDQVTANYFPPVVIPTICPDCGGEGCAACGDVGALMAKTAKKIIDAKRNSRIDALADVLSLNKGDPMIAWCVFDETVYAAIALGERLGLAPLRYDGKVDDAEKQSNKLAFQAGKSALFVSKEASGGRGLNLSAARAMVYVENGYSKRKRSQSEDRCEVSGRTFGTGIYDLIAEDTYDEKKLDAHFAKGEVSDTVWKELREAWAA
jgi:hypothetical protein